MIVFALGKVVFIFYFIMSVDVFSFKTLQLLRKAKLKLVVEIQIIMSSAKLILARVAVFLEFQHHQPTTKSQRIISKVFLIGF